MFRRSEISTEVGKGSFFFTLIALSGSLVAAVFLLMRFKGSYLAIYAAAMMFIIAAASAVVMFGLLSDYAYIREDVLYMHYLFKGSSIPVKEISKAVLQDDVYHIYDRRNDEVGSINSLALGIDKLVHELDLNGVPFL